VFATADTIVAIATPPGRGGIGVVRVSGPDAHQISLRLVTTDRLFEPRHATLTYAVAPSGASTKLDEVVVTYFPAPHSYTGDDVVEVSAHGSPVILQTIVERAIREGARLAHPGEFTLRAFLNGRLDLLQAEAVADLVDAVTPLQARAAFDQLQGTLTTVIGAIDQDLFDLIAGLEASVDFPEEGYRFIEPVNLVCALDELTTRTEALLADARRGRLIREGLQIALIGEPNVGKSSLFNALVGAARAIVTPIPGTTRDLVTEALDLDGVRVTLIDTAGLREVTEVVESEGVARARQVVAVADLVLFVVDISDMNGTSEENAPQIKENKLLVVGNKADLLSEESCDSIRNGCSRVDVMVSARSGKGLDALRTAILAKLDIELLNERPALTNARHVALVERAHEAFMRARDAVRDSSGRVPEEFVLADLQDARAAFEEISGRRTPDDVLAHIFSRFCIGK